MGQTRNLLYASAYRGFESHPLRFFKEEDIHVKGGRTILTSFRIDPPQPPDNPGTAQANKAALKATMETFFRELEFIISPCYASFSPHLYREQRHESKPRNEDGYCFC